MRSFSITDVAFTGFRFIRENLRIVPVWAGAYLVFSLVVGLLTVQLGGPALVELQGIPQTPENVPQRLALLRQLIPFFVVIMTLSLVGNAVIYAAMNRAVLTPGDDRFAYLRFGMDELRQCLLFLLALVVGIGAYIVVALLVFGLLMLAKASGGAFGPKALGFSIVLLVPALICGVIFAVVRLSLASPLTFDRRRVDLFGSWRMTRRLFWKLFGCYLLVICLAVVLGILVLIICAAVAGLLGGMDGLRALFQPDMSSLGAYLTPARLAVMAVGAVASVVVWPVLLMPAPEIYARLTEEP